MNEHCGVPSRLTLMGLDDRKIIGYRPRLNAEVGSVLSTVVLCQVMYWAQHAGNPFYKFIQPCGHHLYRAGDSWVEELGFTRHEFQFAIKRIGQKVSSKTAVYDQEAYIWYWTDMSRVTWYQVNWSRVNALFEKSYPVNPESGFEYIQKVDLRNAGILQYVNPVSGSSLIEHRLTTETNQIRSSSSSSAASSPPPSDDDDDLLVELIELGIGRELALVAIKNNERVVIESKLKDIVKALSAGKVANLTGYAQKVFSQALYSPKQIAAILEKERKNFEKSERPEPLTPDELPEEPLPHLSNDEVNAFVKSIASNKTIYSLWSKRGLESIMVRAAVRNYLRREDEKEF